MDNSTCTDTGLLTRIGNILAAYIINEIVQKYEQKLDVHYNYAPIILTLPYLFVENTRKIYNAIFVSYS